jgi:hypothetical protein
LLEITRIEFAEKSGMNGENSGLNGEKSGAMEKNLVKNGEKYCSYCPLLLAAL